MIILAILGVSCFAAGVVLSINELLITGIVVFAVFIVSLGIFIYFFPKKSQSTVQANPAQRYSINNMNMKRNKSDTDLELINRDGVETDMA